METQAKAVAEYLRQVNLGSVDLRKERALLVAQLIGYRLPLSFGDADETVTRFESQIKKLLGEVNENIHIDIRLALTLVRSIVAIRQKLVHCPTQVDVLRAAIVSESTHIQLDQKSFDMVADLAANGDAMVQTVETLQALEGAFTLDTNV